MACQRDQFTQSTRNSLGSVLTVFSLSDSVIDEVQERLAGKPAETSLPTDDSPTAEAEFELLREDVVSRGHELIKDKIQVLGPEEMEELTAALLRAMGYQTQVAARGPDSGVDVLASPDGLGFTREACYEAERATIPVTLIDIDMLADLVVANYEQFDIEGQRLLPLVKVYWPAE